MDPRSTAAAFKREQRLADEINRYWEGQGRDAAAVVVPATTPSGLMLSGFCSIESNVTVRNGQPHAPLRSNTNVKGTHDN